LRKTLLPPERELWHFGGEIYARLDDGHVYYQDAFGRTEKRRDFLKKEPPAKPLRPNDLCGCGSGRPFKACCKPKPVALRTTWKERSIRERNLMLYNGIVNILGLEEGKDWVAVRRGLTDEKIRAVYGLYQALWPLETDLLQLLPKPDGTARAIYTGSIHPSTITEFALGSSLYFGELIIQQPFIHAGTVKKEFSPVENPRTYRQEVLKDVVFLLNVMPLVNTGLVNLIPDPCNFDSHLRDQMMQMAKSRAAEIDVDSRKEPRLKKLMEEDAKRGIMLLSPDALRSHMRRAMPKLTEAELDAALKYVDVLKLRDPLAVLQEDSLSGGEKGGQFTTMKLAPNFEIALYLSQATGSCIVTDSLFRWHEVKNAINERAKWSDGGLSMLARSIESSRFAIPQNAADIEVLASGEAFTVYPALMRDAFKYLAKLGDRGPKPNVEAHVNAQFVKGHAPAQDAITKARIPATPSRISCAFPLGGIQDNTVNRLLLMSSSEKHLPSVPMAFFIEGQISRQAGRQGG
jgi:hypothetical protein